MPIGGKKIRKRTQRQTRQTKQKQKRKQKTQRKTRQNRKRKRKSLPKSRTSTENQPSSQTFSNPLFGLEPLQQQHKEQYDEPALAPTIKKPELTLIEKKNYNKLLRKKENNPNGLNSFEEKLLTLYINKLNS
tara:strand:- start:302 stop:697 length:396 start_codon:yes stop_codon:yes gene_type:complete